MAENLRARLSHTDFSTQYTRPNRNFNDSAVKGMVVRLVKLQDEKKQWATALEIAAGSKLYNVVVETQQVCLCMFVKVYMHVYTNDVESLSDSIHQRHGCKIKKKNLMLKKSKHS